MGQLQQNLPHMIMGLVAIIAVTLLALEGTITGGEALAVIGGATGFTMAASATSPSAGTAQATIPATSLPPGQTLTETTTHAVSASPTTPTAS